MSGAGIRPKTLRIKNRVLKGYELEDIWTGIAKIVVRRTGALKLRAYGESWDIDPVLRVLFERDPFFRIFDAQGCMDPVEERKSPPLFDGGEKATASGGWTKARILTT